MMEKTDNSAERSRAASGTHDVALRDAGPPGPRLGDHSRHASLANNNNGPERLSNDVWASAISRLQAQVSYNTGMLESHRRQFTEMETALTRLHNEVSNIVAALNDVRSEVRSKPAAPEPMRHDPADMNVFAKQLQKLTDKLHEIEGLRVQFDFMENRMRRIEHAGSAPSAQRPTTSGLGEPPLREVPPPPPGPAPPHSRPQQPPHSAHHQPNAHHPPLPPMRTGSMASPEVGRPPSFPAPHVLESSQGPHGHRPSSESRPFSGEPHPHPHGHPQHPPGQDPRHAEPLPPPSSLSGWRPAHGQHPPHPPNPHQGAPSNHRQHAMDIDPKGGQTSGWTTVNANQPMKRPPEEGRSPYGSPLVDGLKRPKLAPLMPNMPRSNYGEEGYIPSQSGLHSSAATSNPSEASQQPRSRAPSDGSQPPSQPTPASTLQQSFRFITSTQQADSQESWRPESQREGHLPHGHGRGGRGGRGRGRGRGGRGRGGVANAAAAGGPGGPANHHHRHHTHEGQEHGTPEWERPEWSSGQPSPNGFHNHMHPQSPRSAALGGSISRHSEPQGPPPVERHHEFPATPTQVPPPDPYAAPPDMQSSSGKKTRTKPIRNAEGILIRKDGRPDMRSVSSANNLRKVHAKKEAERAEMGDDYDETRSGTPVSGAAGDNDTSDEQDAPPAQERQNQLMSRIFSPGHGHGRDGVRAEQFFPRHEEARSAPMKTESELDGRSREQSSQAADVVMKDSSEAQAEGPPHERDTISKKDVEVAGGQEERPAAGEGDGGPVQPVPAPA